MAEPIIGVIGGTGLGQALSALAGGETVEVETPFGPPSAAITLTDWDGQKIAFLSRHGPRHLLNPSQVPYRANIFALKTLGVKHVLASGATGSLRENIRPRDLVIVDQVIDKTLDRDRTFFDHDIVVHVEFARPFCETLRQALLSQKDQVATAVHERGTYVCMEGPQFSTVAESEMHRAWGGDLIGMTCLPEAKLAREAEMCYATVALATDYDCWQPHDAALNQAALLDQILRNLEAATQQAVALIKATIPRLAGRLDCDCACQQALRLAIWSDKSELDTARLAPLRPLLRKYVSFDG